MSTAHKFGILMLAIFFGIITSLLTLAIYHALDKHFKIDWPSVALGFIALTTVRVTIEIGLKNNDK